MRSQPPAGRRRKPATGSGRKPQTKGRGEGSVYQRDDGRWVGAMSFVDPKTGKRRRKSLYAASEAAARDRLIAAQASMHQGDAPKSGKDTVASFLHRWLEGRIDVRASTRKREEEYIRLHVLPTLGSRRLIQLSVADLEDLYHRAGSDGLSQRSVYHLHNVMHRALEQAVRYDLITSNPAKRVRVPRVYKTPVAFLTRMEATLFLGNLRAGFMAKVISWEQLALFSLALTTGARQGELLALRGEDVDWENDRVSITRSVQLRKTIGNTKTRSSVRTLELTLDTVRRLYTVRPKRASDLFFPSPKNPTVPMSPATVWDAFRRYMLYLGLTKPGPKGRLVPKITFHGLRHTFATLMLAGVPEGTPGFAPMHGLSPNVVAEMLGHSTTALLWETYAHVIPPTEGQAAHLLDAQLSQWDKARAAHER